MNQAPPTRASLLVRLRDPSDQRAWREFVEIYAPTIHAYALRRGFQDADAADLAQEVLRSLPRAFEQFQYDPQRGTFRGWLFTVTRNKLRSMAERRQRQVAAQGGTEVLDLLREVPLAEDEQMWEQEEQQRLFQWALRRVQPDFRGKTWLAFWSTAVEQQSVSDVASRLQMSVGAVYIAKSRVLARLRDEIQAVEEP